MGMRLPAAVEAVVLEYAAAYPVVVRRAGEDAGVALVRAREWISDLASTVKARVSTGHEWGLKRASVDRPQSADVLAIADPFIGWDLVRDAGGYRAALQVGGESIDLAGQVFMPVAAVDLLEEWEAPDPPAPDPPAGADAPAWAAEVVEAVDGLTLQVAQIVAVLPDVLEGIRDVRKEMHAGIKIRLR